MFHVLRCHNKRNGHLTQSLFIKLSFLYREAPRSPVAKLVLGLSQLPTILSCSCHQLEVEPFAESQLGHLGRAWGHSAILYIVIQQPPVSNEKNV